MTVRDIVSTWEQKPFQRGTTDCCAFVDFVLGELTGERPLPAYRDDESAMAIINEHGSLRDAVTHFMGKEPIPADQLKPGDIALVEIMDTQSIGVLMEADKVAVVFEKLGLREVRPDFVDEGWSIGN